MTVNSSVQPAPPSRSTNLLCHLSRFLKSSIGMKFLMGLSGLVWTGFVFVHMAGNMTLLISPEAYNAYGAGIAHNKPLMYGTEVILVLALITHVFLALKLSLENSAARPVGYEANPQGKKQATLAAKTMKYTGSILLFFIISHLLTFKYGAYYTTQLGGVEERDLSKLIYEIFSSPVYVVGYIFCLILLGFHLKHGFAAAFQSLGLRHPRYTPTIKCLAVIYAVVVIGGFVSQPLYVYFFAR